MDYRQYLADLIRASGSGLLGGVLGGPMDTAVNVANLARAGYGYGGHRMGLLGIGDMPEPIDLASVPGTSDWISRRMGVGDSGPEQIALFVGGLLSPGPKTSAMARAAKPKKAPLPMDEVSRMARMEQQKWSGGLFRGELPPDKLPTGNWYASHRPDIAAEFAKRWPGGEVNEYAVRAPLLNASSTYSPKLGTDLARIMRKDGHERFADMLNEYAKQGPFSGLEVWRGLEKNVGADAAARYLKEVGFGGVAGHKGQLGAQYVQLWETTPRRNVKRAEFNPDKLDSLSTLAGLGGVGLLGLGLLNEEQTSR